MLFDFCREHVWSNESTLGPFEGFTCRSNSTPDCIKLVCFSDFQKCDFILYQRKLDFDLIGADEEKTE